MEALTKHIHIADRVILVEALTKHMHIYTNTLIKDLPILTSLHFYSSLPTETRFNGETGKILK